jgi:hypothetical protein
MSSKKLTLVASFALALLVASAALAGGPPWISVEAPVDPIDETAGGAVVLAHVRLCGRPVETALKATVESTVDGRRVSRKIDVVPAGEKGVYAVKGDVPTNGSAVLVLSATVHAPTAAIVELGPPLKVEHYSRSVSLAQVRSVRVLDHVPTERDLAPYFRAALGQ